VTVGSSIAERTSAPPEADRNSGYAVVDTKVAEQEATSTGTTKATTYHRVPSYRLGCTPDYWANDDGLIQVKTCSPQQWEKWHGRAPLAYVLQTLTELIVTGRRWGVLAVMVCNPSYPVHYFDVPPHEAAERRILTAVKEWWRAFDAGEIPHAAPSADHWIHQMLPR
jgi:hypothetical protein